MNSAQSRFVHFENQDQNPHKQSKNRRSEAVQNNQLQTQYIRKKYEMPVISQQQKNVIKLVIFIIFSSVITIGSLYFANQIRIDTNDERRLKPNQYGHKKIKIKQLATKQQKLDQLLKNYSYYDIHHFRQNQTLREIPKVYHQSNFEYKHLLIEKRQLLQTKYNFQEIQQIINMMQYPQIRPTNVYDKIDNDYKKQKQISLSYFFNELNLQPDNPIYLQAQFYHYNKIYDISKYGSQLSLCVIVSGRNNAFSIQKMYNSIQRQNYTNYKIIHVDDNSTDDTIKNTLKYYQTNQKIKQRSTLVSQTHQKNIIYNRNYAINYCRDEDIVVDIDTDDWLIGNQVFQLINSLYQTGKYYRGKKQQIWAIYFNHIQCCPNISAYGPVSDAKIHDQSYRKDQSRAFHLRTYLKKVYDKINKRQLIDPLMFKKGQFFVTGENYFLHSPIIQMSAPKHILFVDEFLYYDSTSLTRKMNLQENYSIAVAQNYLPYLPLTSINATAKRNIQFKLNQTLYNNRIKQKSSQIQSLRLALQQQVQKIQQSFNTKYFDLTILQKIQQRNPMKNVDSQFKQNYAKKLSIEFQTSKKKSKYNFNYQDYNLKQNIQIGSQYDYTNIVENTNLQMVEQSLFKQLPYQTLTFTENKSLNSPQLRLKYEYFENQTEIKNYIENLDINRTKNKQIDRLNFQYYLGTRLAMKNIDQITLQMQYYYYNQKYKIGKQMKQKPICLFSSGYNTYSQNKYTNFLHSIQRLNYTNYKILLVDDNSPDNSAYEIYQYLRTSNMKIKNKIKIIHNLQRVGMMGNIHMHIKNYCGENDIVVICDTDDNLVGTQVFKILNHLYENHNFWYIYSRYISPIPNRIGQFNLVNISSELKVPVKQYRTAEQQWVTSHLKTFRKKVIDAIPLEHFIQYVVDSSKKSDNGNKNIAYPHYYSSAADRCLVYSALQVSGDKRIHFITDVLYNYNQPQTQVCYRTKELIDQYKCRMKTPLKPLSQKQKIAKYEQNYKMPLKTINKLKNLHLSYKQCMKKHHYKN